jgi:hypothetical protein
MTKQFVPKGGMCASCIHRLRDCSDLPFKEMRRLNQYTDNGNEIVTVACNQQTPIPKQRVSTLGFLLAG